MKDSFALAYAIRKRKNLGTTALKEQGPEADLHDDIVERIIKKRQASARAPEPLDAEFPDLPELDDLHDDEGEPEPKPAAPDDDLVTRVMQKRAKALGAP